MAELVEMSDRVPAINLNVVNAKMLVVEFLTAQGYDAERYIAGAKKNSKFRKKITKKSA